MRRSSVGMAGWLGGGSAFGGAFDQPPAFDQHHQPHDVFFFASVFNFFGTECAECAGEIVLVSCIIDFKEVQV